MRDKIISVLADFKVNECCFKEKDIPESFSDQVIEFIETIIKQRTQQYELQTRLLTCLVDKDPVIEKITKCNDYLNTKFIKDIQEKRYQEWTKQISFNFFKFSKFLKYNLNSKWIN